LEELLVNFTFEFDVVQEEVELRSDPESEMPREALVSNISNFKLLHTFDDLLMGILLDQVVLDEI
jgi:hypothetical protein